MCITCEQELIAVFDDGRMFVAVATAALLMSDKARNQTPVSSTSSTLCYIYI